MIELTEAHGMTVVVTATMSTKEDTYHLYYCMNPASKVSELKKLSHFRWQRLHAKVSKRGGVSYEPINVVSVRVFALVLLTGSPIWFHRLYRPILVVNQVCC